jgi:hypothetical protein
MRWARRCCSVNLTQTNNTTRTAKSCGPGIPVLMPSRMWR